MPIVVGVRFKDSGKTYHFDPGDLALELGDQVIVETVRGQELAKIVYSNQQIAESEIVGELKPVVRRAEPSDFERLEVLQQRHDEVLAKCKEKVAQHSLPMRLIKAEYSFDGSRLTFYFTAEKRVDFRMLVRDLARTFKTRIELRQIGPRDEAKLLGGIGPCGRLLCCATFLPDYARVSIKMAKDQDLPLNPSKISGVCGRLLCCLSYEHEQYVQIKAELPKLGAWVHTPQGSGEVISVNVVKETVTVTIEGLDEPVEATRDEIRGASEQVGAVARARAEQGVAAPITRHRRSEAFSEGEEPSSDVLEALELLEQGPATLGTAPPAAGPGSREVRPHTPAERRAPRSEPHEAAQPQPSRDEPRQRHQVPGQRGATHHRQPPARDSLPPPLPPRLEVPLLPEPGAEQAMPVDQESGKARRHNRRRRRGGGGGGGEQE